MTENQIIMYSKLRNKLRIRGVTIELTPKTVSTINNQRSYMIINAMSQGVKNLDAWDKSQAFRQACFNEYGCDFNIYSKVYEEVTRSLGYYKVPENELEVE